MGRSVIDGRFAYKAKRMPLKGVYAETEAYVVGGRKSDALMYLKGLQVFFAQSASPLNPYYYKVPESFLMAMIHQNVILGRWAFRARF